MAVLAPEPDRTAGVNRRGVIECPDGIRDGLYFCGELILKSEVAEGLVFPPQELSATPANVREFGPGSCNHLRKWIGWKCPGREIREVVRPGNVKRTQV